MIRTQTGSHNRSEMVAVHGTSCAIKSYSCGSDSFSYLFIYFASWLHFRHRTMDYHCTNIYDILYFYISNTGWDWTRDLLSTSLVPVSLNHQSGTSLVFKWTWVRFQTFSLIWKQKCDEIFISVRTTSHLKIVVEQISEMSCDPKSCRTTPQTLGNASVAMLYNYTWCYALIPEYSSIVFGNKTLRRILDSEGSN
jgi:hypothetical protein